MTRALIPLSIAAAAAALTVAVVAGCSSPKPVVRPEPKPAEAALQIDAAFAEAVTLAAEDRPDVDVGATNARLNRYIVEVGIESRSARTTRELAEAVARVFFGHYNFQVDPDDPEGRKLSSFDVPRVLERRRGACLPLAIIVARAASGAGLAAGVARVPGHAVVVVGPPSDRLYVDPGDRGAVRVWGEVERARPWSPAAVHVYNGKPLFADEILAQLRASRAAIRLAAGDTPRAEADARAALQVTPDLPEALVNLGAIELKRKNVDEAWRLLQRAHELLPKNAIVNYNCGLAATARGDALGAISYYQAALEADPGMEAARANKAALESTLQR
jgi:tetratricopeptide (TPR) repeat protein